MERTPVTSSTIGSIGYDPMTAVLEVEFSHGDTYLYFMVPHSIHLGFLGAPSKGRFFRDFVRGKYQFQKL